MGNAGNSNRGQRGITSQAAAERRFVEALENAAGGKPLDEEGLKKRRDMIAQIAQNGPKKPERFITARDFITEREAGVTPLDKMFPRDGSWER